MDNEKSLRETIEHLYSAFARYPLRKHVEGCPCCVSEPDKKRLEAKPLRQLLAGDLRRYAFKAMTTWGDKNDFRHFLPRILELLISNDGIECDEEVVLGKLALAKWHDWPVPEQSAVREYFHAGWTTILFTSEPTVAPDSWLCGLGRAGEDLQPYLNEWTNARNASAYEHLVAFVEWHQPTYVKRHSLNNPFWPDTPKAVAQVCDWLTSSDTISLLETTYFQNESAPFADTLARTINCLTQIAKA